MKNIFKPELQIVLFSLLSKIVIGIIKKLLYLINRFGDIIKAHRRSAFSDKIRSDIVIKDIKETVDLPLSLS